MTVAIEGAEDDAEQGAQDLRTSIFNPKILLWVFLLVDVHHM